MDDKEAERPVLFLSRTLNKAERNYSTTEKECLAIVWATKQCRPYLYGKKFIVRIDHQPLTWLSNVKDPGSKLVRWRLKLEEYSYKIEYKKGKDNTVANELSRNCMVNAIIRTADGKFEEVSGRHMNDISEEILGYRHTEIIEDTTVINKHGDIISKQDGQIERQFKDGTVERIPLSNENEQTDDDIEDDHQSKDEDEEAELQAKNNPVKEIVNEDEQRKIIKTAHNGLIGGHRGMNACEEFIKRTYFWKNMRQHIED
ncbi:unnamed protein product [Hermetia illucens]|uniref:RNA-directed DNA polymerase n=1 Tax=Hermetia illucens TaxID=343691 RepID=A0A7R8YZG8_HERIL|nr:unnamed protein product [Hermetia illucens]